MNYIDIFTTAILETQIRGSNALILKVGETNLTNYIDIFTNALLETKLRGSHSKKTQSRESHS